MKEDLRLRLTQSVETAIALAEGLVTIDLVETGESLTYSERFACPEHGVSLPELQPRIFSFNSPHGACPRCTGLGAQQEIDPDLLVPDPEPLDRRGRARAVGGRQLELLRVGDPGDRRALRDRRSTGRGRSLTEQQQGYFLYGTDGDKVYVTYRNRMGRRRAYTIAFEGIVASLERRYRDTDSSTQRERIEEYMSFRPCPVCKGARLKPEVLAVTVGERNIHEFTQLSVTAALALPRPPRPDDDRGADRRADREGDPRAADVPRQRRRRLSRARPRVRDALGRRGAAATARDADRLAARRRPLHPRRAVDRAPPARQRPADRDARAASRPRQHRARRRARRADDAQRGLARRHGPGRRRARRPRRGRGDGGEGAADEAVGHRPVPLRRARDRRAGAAHGRPGRLHRARRRPAQPEGNRRRVSRRSVRRGHRRLRLRQVDARERDRLQVARKPALRRCASSPASTRRSRGSRPSTR